MMDHLYLADELKTARNKIITMQAEIDAYRKGLDDISSIRYGYDGDCGAVRIADNLLGKYYKEQEKE